MTGSPLTYTFFRLFGDSSGDGNVNLTDYRAFVATYLRSSRPTRIQFDRSMRITTAPSI